MLGLALTMSCAYAQNYKAPKIDASGRVTDKNGKYVGNVTKEGVITDSAGVKVAYVDATGTALDASGKKLGKAGKNGNFVSQFEKTPDEGWSVSAPMNGTCLVKDKDGNVKAEIHENYKEFGACAVHCLTHHTDHAKVMDEKKSESVAYACPMHPDVTSDKPGKCSKCGMSLVKKK